ncbi:uncharacterized protein I303_100663 [Kwoniella dejecticola CBS 10117]|uniref:Uncharacterized protein n=1 Tax=Kwoniella dejecticola CBS 10117 TaxID=1296121 RepID=A0A1A6AFK3_9TREE|nr:uncharacterized protein I303_00667 [Kwoniella dejecticola CBS 10117]OBR88850.1 hypothetical protein I303_00667 [Kwoniella dejecticola CBS 10117]
MSRPKRTRPQAQAQPPPSPAPSSSSSSSSSSFTEIIQTPQAELPILSYCQDVETMKYSGPSSKRQKTSHTSFATPTPRTRQPKPSQPDPSVKLRFSTKSAGEDNAAQIENGSLVDAVRPRRGKTQVSSIASFIRRRNEPKRRKLSGISTINPADVTIPEEDTAVDSLTPPRCDIRPAKSSKKTKAKVNFPSSVKSKVLEEVMDFVYEKLDFGALSREYGIPKAFLKDQFKSYAGHPKSLTHTNLRKSVLDIHQMDLSFLAPNVEHSNIIEGTTMSKQGLGKVANDYSRSLFSKPNEQVVVLSRDNEDHLGDNGEEESGPVFDQSQDGTGMQVDCMQGPKDLDVSMNEEDGSRSSTKAGVDERIRKSRKSTLYEVLEVSEDGEKGMVEEESDEEEEEEEDEEEEEEVEEIEPWVDLRNRPRGRLTFNMQQWAEDRDEDVTMDQDVILD